MVTEQNGNLLTVKVGQICMVEDWALIGSIVTDARSGTVLWPRTYIIRNMADSYQKLLK